MNVSTARFGEVTIDDDDVLTFASGLIGMEQCQRWVLLADAENTALGWLQSLDRPEVALAVVSPRRFVPEYQIRVSRRDVEALELPEVSDVQVLGIVSQTSSGLTVNLKAPLLVNIEQRLGRQIIARDDHAVQHCLTPNIQLRKSA